MEELENINNNAVTYKAVVAFQINIKGTKYVIHEGDIVENLCYVTGTGTKYIDRARVCSLVAFTSDCDEYPNACPPMPYIDRYVTAKYMTLDCSRSQNAIFKSVIPNQIVSIDRIIPAGEYPDAIVIGDGPQYIPLPDLIDLADDGATIYLTKGVYSQDIHICKSLNLIGAPGATITGNVSIDCPEDNRDVVIDGITFTDKGNIEVGQCDELTIRNCTFYDHTDATTLISLNTEISMAFRLINNTFNEQNSDVEHLVRSYALLRKGTEFMDNELGRYCCNGHAFEIFNVLNGSKVENINFTGNHAVRSDNMVHLRFKTGTPRVHIVMDDNSYDSTNIDRLLAGLIMIQPYRDETVSLAHVYITISDTTHSDGNHIAYFGYCSTDMKLPNNRMPVVYVDGIKVTLDEVEIETPVEDLADELSEPDMPVIDGDGGVDDDL